jgi:DMSO/TMAO reductase YedYZ molybdopterin-dependent catalytic subunit
VTDNSRRRALQYTAIVGVGALSWRLQESVGEWLSLPGADRRFTGSKAEGSDAGNDFPITSWVADDPDPIGRGEWSLRVGGETDQDLTLGYDDLASDGELRATLDCTSGWYSVHDWQGVRVGDLLDAVGTTDGAQWVRFESVTGYRWSLPIEEARDALLATHVDGERLSHGHGAPMRLVAPDRRGFQWVKWVTGVTVMRRRDRSEWLAIFVSGLDE